MQWVDLVYGYGYWGLLPVIVYSAWKVGGKPEQLASAMFVIAAIISEVVIAKREYAQMETALFAVDLLLLAGLVWLSLSADRIWPMPSAALQAISCLSHLEKLIEPHSRRLAYQLMAGASVYPTLLLLSIGIWNVHRQRIKRL